MFELLLGCHLCQAGTLKAMQLAALESPTMLFSVVILIESRMALEIGLWTCPWGTVLIAIEEGRSTHCAHGRPQDGSLDCVRGEGVSSEHLMRAWLLMQF